MVGQLKFWLLVLILAQSTGTASLRVEVLDETRAVIDGAQVSLVPPNGPPQEATRVAPGVYSLTGLGSGRYTVRVEAKGFGSYERNAVDISKGEVQLRVVLRVRLEDQHVFVTSALPPSATPEFLGGVRVLRGRALDSLPDRFDEMMAYFRLLAPRSSGPFGPTILVDGFPSLVIPPKSQIREIRINDNPFSAEYSAVGISRVEILTKPGTEGWQSSAFLNFNDESLNSRNTFATGRAPFQSRVFGGSISGPLIRNKLTFRTDIERAERDDNAIINATIVDPTFTIRPLNRTLIKPSRQINASGTLNYQLTPNNTLAAVFRFSDQHSAKDGVGDFSLESRAYDSFTKTHTIQFTNTSVLSDTVINETRFQIERRRLRQAGDDSVAVIRIPEAFVSGGSENGRVLNRADSIFVNSFTTWTAGKHTVKFGGEFRGVRRAAQSSANVGGTYTFTGRIAPQLDANDNPLTGADGKFLLAPITNIESYRRTLVFQKRGLSADQLRLLGGGASLYSISSGTNEAGVRQYESAIFLKDDWSLRKNLSLDLGLRLESQTNIDRRLDFAPRLAVAWQPISKTVVRAGSGLFFNRFDEELTMQAKLLNGAIGQQFFTSVPEILDQFPKTLSVSSLRNLQILQSVWRKAGDVRAPYNVYSSFSAERVMPLRSTLGVTFTHTRGLHALRSRNINAPLPNGLRPITDLGDVFQFESSGIVDEKRYIANTTHNLSERIVWWSTYTLTDARSDTEGPFSFPADSYNLRNEYARSASVARHTVYTGGWLNIPGGIQLNPLVMWRSGLPFNITTGSDNNGDSQFTERPAIAVVANKDSVVQTAFGALDLQPMPGQPIVQRNVGLGPSFAIVNLRLAKYISLGRSRTNPNGPSMPSPRQLMIAVQGQNLFNKTNLGTPIGNLSSPLFGRSNSAAGDFGFGSNSAGTRRLDFTIVISF